MLFRLFEWHEKSKAKVQALNNTVTANPERDCLIDWSFFPLLMTNINIIEKKQSSGNINS